MTENPNDGPARGGAAILAAPAANLVSAFSRRSPYDRELARFAGLALGTLAIQPLYVLVDTAIVGHLGRPQLAALAVAGFALSFLFAILNFVTYATTGEVGRFAGAGDLLTARRLGGQALWLSSSLGVVIALAVVVAAHPIVRTIGAGGRTADLATTYLRISALAVPLVFVSLAGHGFLRGLSDLRTPLFVILGGNSLNVILEPTFVYGLHWGLRGAAAATALAQAAMGAAFLILIVRAAAGELRLRPALAARLGRIGRNIFVRTLALYTSILLAGAVAARFGDAAVAAHRVAFQIWVFLSLVLDSIAVAAQVLVARMLGAGDAEGAIGAARRAIAATIVVGSVFGVVLLAASHVVVRAFTGDAAVVAQADRIWPLLVVALPLSGAVYALDGVLIGAGDVRYLMWAMLGSALVGIALTLAAWRFGWGIRGIWAALLVLNGVRLATLAPRFARASWVVTGTR